MTKIFLLVLLGVLAAVSVADNDSYVPPEPPTTKPTTTEVPTTSAKPTITTTKTTSTSTPSTPTTKSTTTTKPTPAPPTPPPTPAPTHAPTPAPEPPKPVDPSVGVWQVISNATANTSCLLVQFALQIDVPYNTTNNKNFTAAVNVPPNATATGACGNEFQNITLEWSVGTKIVNQIFLNFANNAIAKKYKLIFIEVLLTPDNTSFPGLNDTHVLHLIHNYKEFGTSESKSYKCAKSQKLNLTDTDLAKPRGYISVSHLQFQAFHDSTNKQFASAEDCSPFDTPDVVPIAVGCALAALVIIVLVAYLIGRRRRQARGYLSM